MTLGEIPVDQLTHLNIAFGYIDKEFRITNMDGIAADLYKNVGNLKAKNPDLKIIIALGGWTFSDPGPWQDVFPSLASTSSNRATFIKNLLGFLDEYGYDGVDFDWEYPGAKDRGGSGQDGANFVSIVKELQAAIKASGHDYIVTYTAPTSYWYLRHFDPKAMEPYVDWINLMSYDLHGTWDSDNPIGSQVLAHSNLTEIDLALDLFWRVGVDPKNIVLGLGFYGRSFKLDSPSCWKPGCRFEGPGDKGPCTDTAGILSYREIQNIISKTGATSYHDRTAAVRYLVYGDNNWISYDDPETFQAKIDYANKMGLSGLMVWAIDQDDSTLSALTAVTGGTPRRHSSGGDFDLVDLKRLFPKEDIPSDTSDPQYGLITFGAGSESGEVDPANSGFGFLLAVGESHGLTQLKARDGRPDPFVFLDCPDNVLDQPSNQTQKARVVCTSQDVDGCFRVRERGVEGTLVEMPDDCAPNSFARAIALELAEDQTMPDHLVKRHTPTSPIYEFSFDFNKHERRADAKVAIRMDMTNVKGYWDGLVDSPGVQRRDLERRYFSFLNLDWKRTFEKGDKFKYGSGENSLKIQKDLSTPVFWQAADNCPIGDKDYGEGIAGFIKGKVDADMYYAATVIATSARDSSNVDVKEANGFIKVTGETDLTFGIGGMGRLDINMAKKGNPAKSEIDYEALKGHTISAGSFWGYMSLTPFINRQTVLFASYMDEGPSSGPNHAATLDGRLTTRVKTDLGDFPATFPHILFPDEMDSIRKHHKDTEIEVFDDDVLYGDGGRNGSTIQIGHHLAFGLDLHFGILPLVQGQDPTKMSKSTSLLVTSQTYASWEIPPAKDDQVCPHASVKNILRQEADGKEFLGWEGVDGMAILFDDNPTPNHEQCYSTKSKRATVEFPSPRDQSAAIPSSKLNKRGQPNNPKDNFGSMRLRPNDALRYGADLFVEERFDQRLGEINCDNGRCNSCLDVEETRNCCGCVCMQCKWGARADMPPCSKCTSEDDRDEEDWPGPNAILKRDQMEGDALPEKKVGGESVDHLNDLHARAGVVKNAWKDVYVCGKLYEAPNKRGSPQYKFPQFPKDVMKVWDGVDGGIYDSISRYWGNSSADCVDWSIGAKRTRDQTHVGNGVFLPSAYQTEHVYEGQNLGQFFTEWLTHGQIQRQSPSPGTTTGKVDCDWVEDWIMNVDSVDFPWTNPSNPGEAYPLFGTLYTELGNNHHKDRLAILQERLNRKKENIFDLANSYSPGVYTGLSTDEQWMTVKEIGLTFSYMNDDTIWGMWCDTFKGVYDRLDRFDKWYTVVKGPDDPDVTLAEEWAKYNRIVLDSAVRIYRAGWDWTYEKRRTNSVAFLLTPEEGKWRLIRTLNSKTNAFHLKKLCTNLPPTTIV
ncbi:hypothetical protein ACHAQC_011832 [Fusarium culmorum]